MRVLVTGNLGYIGPVVTAHLKAAGHYVIGLDTGWFLPNYAELPVWPDEQLFGDIRDESPPEVDAVVHLAGLSNDPMGEIDAILTGNINLWGTLDRIGGAGRARHVIVSSCSVYGSAEMATEETPVAPLTVYANSKATVDEEAPQYATNVVSLRLGTVYGYSPGHRLDLVVNRMTYDAVRGKGITVNGNAARPLVHVEDVARAIEFMLERPETGIFNVVGENYRIADLAGIVADGVQRAIGQRPLVNYATAGADQRDYAASGSKLEGLGWLPKYRVHYTISRLAEQSFNLPGLYSRYVRLDALKRLIDAGALTPDLRRKDNAAA